MNETRLPQQNLLDSRQTLSLYLETLFRENVVDQNEPIRNQSAPARKQDLEAMLIRFGRHKLALPIKDIKAVVQTAASPIRHLPEQAAYILGTIAHNGKNIPVCDLNWVFNASNQLQQPETVPDSQNLSQVIVFKGENMAIACDGADKVMNLKQYEIRWNRQLARNTWLQGIVLENMASLLDVRQIKRLFRNGTELEKTHPNLTPA